MQAGARTLQSGLGFKFMARGLRALGVLVLAGWDVRGFRPEPGKFVVVCRIIYRIVAIWMGTWVLDRGCVC